MKNEIKINNFIDKCLIKDINKYDYSLVEYKNGSVDKVKIICRIHGIFEQLPESHLNGRGCPKCRGWYKTNDYFINEVKLLHGDKYEYSLTKYKNSTTKISIICPTHGEFTQKPHHHLEGQGCPKCSGIGKTTEEFIKNANILHSDKY